MRRIVNEVPRSRQSGRDQEAANREENKNCEKTKMKKPPTISEKWIYLDVVFHAAAVM